MERVYAILTTLSALFVLSALIPGALSDIKTRTFPAKYWEWPSRVAGVCTIMLYLTMISTGNLEYVAVIIALSIVATLACFFCGYRFGSGGDWRALAYIALLTPWLFLGCIFWSLLSGFFIAIYTLLTNKEAHLLKANIPFAVAILIEYCFALAIFIANS